MAENVLGSCATRLRVLLSHCARLRVNANLPAVGFMGSGIVLPYAGLCVNANLRAFGSMGLGIALPDCA